MVSEQDFSFWVPIDSIEKAKDKEGKDIMKIRGVASTADKDLDGEILEPEGFDLSYFKTSGYLNWHHMKTPDGIIGEPTDAYVKDNKLYIEATLYAESKLAQEAYKLAQVLDANSTNRRLGFSIEGKALEKEDLDDSHILRALLTGCALTPMPKNPKSFAEIVKALGVPREDSSSEDIEKAHTASKEKVKKVMEEFKQGELKSSSGEKVTSRKQAVAIALSEAGLSKGEDFATFVAKEEEFAKSNDLIDPTEDEEKEEEKALTAESSSGRALNRESVDPDMKYLTKGEVCETICKDFSTITDQQVTRVYHIIETLAQRRNNNMTGILEEDIQKAYSALGIKPNDINISKGQAGKHSEPDEDDNDGDDDNDEDDEEVEKAIREEMMSKAEEAMDDMSSMCKAMLQKGKNKKACMSSMMEKGYSKGLAEKAYMLTKAQMMKVDNDHDEDDNEDMKRDVEKGIVDSYNKLRKAQMDIEKGFEDKFGRPIPGASKAQTKTVSQPTVIDHSDEIAELRSEIAESKKIIKSYQNEFKLLNEAIDDLAQEPVQKSITKGVTGTDRFSEDRSSNRDRNQPVALDRIRDKATILNRMDELAFNKGVMDVEFARAMTTFESSGNLPANIIERLSREGGINIASKK